MTARRLPIATTPEDETALRDAFDAWWKDLLDAFGGEIVQEGQAFACFAAGWRRALREERSARESE